MKQLSVMIKPASSSCNLRCRYCFYADVSQNRQQANYGIMSEEVQTILIQRVLTSLDQGSIVFSFQGGEPTLAGLPWFEQFVKKVEQLRTNQEIRYALQTNGTLIDEKWADFFHRHHFLVGVSLDGYQTNMDRFRVDAAGKGVTFQVLRGISLLRKKQVDVNILTVVTRSLAQSPRALYRYYQSHHFQFVQLIPCLPPLAKQDDEALTPSLYASFFSEFFDCWFEDVLRGRMLEVNLFSNLLEMLSGRPPYQCGMIGRCFIQYVIEADGSVYPCDFYGLDEHRIGNIQNDTLEAMRESAAAQRFLNQGLAEQPECEACPYRLFCHGGCPRQQICYVKDGECGYRTLLEWILPRLQQLL